MNKILDVLSVQYFLEQIKLRLKIVFFSFEQDKPSKPWANKYDKASNFYHTHRDVQEVFMRTF